MAMIRQAAKVSVKTNTPIVIGFETAWKPEFSLKVGERRWLISAFDYRVSLGTLPAHLQPVVESMMATMEGQKALVESARRAEQDKSLCQKTTFWDRLANE